MCRRRHLLQLLPGGLLAAGAVAASQTVAMDSQRWAPALQRARQLRDEAVRRGDQPYGAVVVDGERIVGEAGSRVVQLGNADAHAERQALLEAQRQLQRTDLRGLVLVSSSRPCAVCEAAAARAGIARMIFGDGRDGGVPRAH